MDLYRLAWPWIRRLDPEDAHGYVLKALALGLGPRLAADEHPQLRSRVLGLDLPNPLGLAAGFDKNAMVPEALLGLGFGFVELGGVTLRPQPGNPRPRVFRLEEDLAVINRMGFNNDGMAVVAGRLAARRPKGVVGINLGLNKDSATPEEDYAKLVAAFAPLVDFMTLNVSSPNTPGLRALQGREALDGLLAAALAARDAVPGPRKPLLVKIAPDLTASDRADIAEIALARGIDGMIISNTTTARPETLESPLARETGGLSGTPLFRASTDLLGKMYRLTEGRLPLIGCGGVSTGAGAYAKIRAGASMVQLYTALIYRGPKLIAWILEDLARLLARDGFSTIADAVGADFR